MREKQRQSRGGGCRACASLMRPRHRQRKEPTAPDSTPRALPKPASPFKPIPWHVVLSTVIDGLFWVVLVGVIVAIPLSYRVLFPRLTFEIGEGKALPGTSKWPKLRNYIIFTLLISEKLA